jgi:hypothetical protein
VSAPDFAEPVVAWRTWRVVRAPEGLRLGSVVYPTVWEPRHEVTCDCLATKRRLWPLRRRVREDHDPPEAACTCGIYASRDVALASRYAFSLGFEGRGTVARVIGLVALWGRVLACERGWRAQFAYPRRIYVLHRRNADERPFLDLAFALAGYGVPVELVPHRGERDLIRSLARTEAASLRR